MSSVEKQTSTIQQCPSKIKKSIQKQNNEVSYFHEYNNKVFKYYTYIHIDNFKTIVNFILSLLKILQTQRKLVFNFTIQLIIFSNRYIE